MSEFIRARNVTVEGPDTTIVQRMSLLVPRGLTAIVGPSGSGKSTLANTLFGLRVPSYGTIDHLDENGEVRYSNNAEQQPSLLGRVARAATIETKQQRRELAYRSKYLGYIAQSPHLYPNLPVGDHIRLSQQARGNDVDWEYVSELSEQLGIEQHLGKRAADLSGGERQRAAIVASLAHRPEGVVADEPTSALDSVSTNRVLDLFKKLTSDGTTSILMVSHDAEALSYADAVVSMRDGRLEGISKK